MLCAWDGDGVAGFGGQAGRVGAGLGGWLLRNGPGWRVGWGGLARFGAGQAGLAAWFCRWRVVGAGWFCLQCGLACPGAMVWTFTKTPRKPSLEHFHITPVRSYFLVSIAFKYRCV